MSTAITAEPPAHPPGQSEEPTPDVLTPERLYRDHARELTAFATTLIGPDDAPDVVADVFSRLIRRTPEIRPATSRAYLYRAVLNECMSWRRRHARAQLPRPAARPVPDPPEASDPVLAAISGLSIRQRAVIVLAYWRDLAPQEIASQLGISEGAVRRHLARARANLRTALTDGGPKKETAT